MTNQDPTLAMCCQEGAHFASKIEVTHHPGEGIWISFLKIPRSPPNHEAPLAGPVSPTRFFWGQKDFQGQTWPNTLQGQPHNKECVSVALRARSDTNDVLAWEKCLDLPTMQHVRLLAGFIDYRHMQKNCRVGRSRYV